MENPESKKYNLVVVAASIVLPLLVGLLYFAPKPDVSSNFFKVLPLVNACLNGTTAIVLIMGYIAIRKGNRELHQRFMTFGIILSVFFLLSYVAYHSTVPATKFGGEGGIKTLYLIVLLSHILTAVINVPLVLFTFTKALQQNFDKHRKLARITLPVWLYVSITGVVVYLMISPYYQ